jgi:hypothetical protein
MTDTWTPARASRVLAEIFLAPDPTDIETHDAWCEAADGLGRDEALADSATPEEIARWLAPSTPAEEAAAQGRREDLAAGRAHARPLDELGFPDDAAFVRHAA